MYWINLDEFISQLKEEGYNKFSCMSNQVLDINLLFKHLDECKYIKLHHVFYNYGLQLLVDKLTNIEQIKNAFEFELNNFIFRDIKNHPVGYFVLEYSGHIDVINPFIVDIIYSSNIDITTNDVSVVITKGDYKKQHPYPEIIGEPFNPFELISKRLTDIDNTQYIKNGEVVCSSNYYYSF